MCARLPVWRAVRRATRALSQFPEPVVRCGAVDLFRLVLRTHRVRRVVAITLILASVVTGLAYGARAGARFDRDGISFQVPQGWHLTIGRINGVIDPVTVFTVSTFLLQRARTSSGVCSSALQRAWRADGAYVQLSEERDGASRQRMLRRVPLRPKHFVLDASGQGGLCTPADSGGLSFQASGRAFDVNYGFGPRASKATRARAAAMLDAMRITSGK
jgi:hypothetical protein